MKDKRFNLWLVALLPQCLLLGYWVVFESEPFSLDRLGSMLSVSALSFLIIGIVSAVIHFGIIGDRFDD